MTDVESLRAAISQAVHDQELGLCEPWMVQYDARTELIEIVFWTDPPRTVNRKGRRMVVTALQEFPAETLGEIVQEMRSGTRGASG